MTTSTFASTVYDRGSVLWSSTWIILCLATSLLTAKGQSDPYAKAVIEAVILNGSVGNDFKNTASILGPPDNAYLSLGGPGASIIVDLGVTTPVVDAPGPDLEVREIGAAQGGADESYRVYISNSTATNSFLEVGIGRAISLFDISVTGLSSARYVRIVDLATETLNSTSPGSDIDAITALHNNQLPPGPVQVQARFTGQGAWISWHQSTATNLQGYALRRSLDGVTFDSTPDFTFPTNETAYHDLSLPVVGNLYYAVSALTSAGESAFTVVHLPGYTLPVYTNGPVHLGDDQLPAWEVPNAQALMALEVALDYAPAGPAVELVFECFNVDYSLNAILVNGARVAEVPVQNSESWVAKSVKFAAGALSPGTNQIIVSARNSNGGGTGPLDDYQIRNIHLRLYGPASETVFDHRTRITSLQLMSPQQIKLKWVVEKSANLASNNWQIVSDPIEWTGTSSIGQSFYRLREVQ